MATFNTVIIAVVTATLVQGQRPSFAGTRPIGFPEIQNKTTPDPLGNRFGEGNATTERLPIEANGDRDLIDRISKFPIDQQPFWYLNWKALEAQRKNPQIYPQRPSQFAVQPLGSSGTLNANSVPANSGASNSGVPNIELGNRYGNDETSPNMDQNKINAGLQSSRNNMTALGHFPSKR